ncbi:MAG: glycosyltransferase family 39 protein [Bacteroidota bacterium]
MPTHRSASAPAVATQERGVLTVLIGLAMLKVSLHLAVAVLTPYGLHRDELLYLALGDHLAWGYREVPPLMPALGAAVEALLGSSLVAVRLLPALAGGLVVLATGLLVRAFGGGRYAVLLAALAVFAAPVFMRTHSLFQPVVFDQAVWVLAALALVWRVAQDEPRWWLGVGTVLGLGLLFKVSAAFFGLAIAVGVLLTPLRRDFATPWPWAGAGLAVLLALPYLLWQVAHGWPFFEHMAQLSARQLVHVARTDFLLEQILMMHPLTVPIWGTGLWFFFSRRGAPYRPLGWAFLVALGLFLALRGKAYYLAPAYPMLFAGGAVVLAGWLRARWARATAVILLLIGVLAFAPLGVPVLPPAPTAAYAVALGVETAVKTETGEMARLPQDFADMLGWEEQVAVVDSVFRALPADAQPDAILLASNYGQAAAIDFYGPAHTLPAATSYASSYYAWGPGDRAGTMAVAVGVPARILDQLYEDCAVAAVVQHPWVVEYETNLPIQVCQRLRQPLAESWPTLERYR